MTHVPLNNFPNLRSNLINKNLINISVTQFATYISKQ